MSFVTHRPAHRHGNTHVDLQQLEEVRRSVRLGILCCDLTKSCLDKASEVLSDFSICLTMAARKFLLLSAMKILDIRYVLHAL